MFSTFRCTYVGAKELSVSVKYNVVANVGKLAANVDINWPKPSEYGKSDARYP